MSELISDEWMKSFPTVWNADKGSTTVRGFFGFKPTISYGFKGNNTSLGVAYISKKLPTLTGDKNTMIDGFRIVRPFIKSFAVMGKA